MPDLTIPLTYEQEWYARGQRTGTGTGHHIRISFRIEGDLDVDALEHSAAGFVTRHDALRMRVGATGQHVEPAAVDRPLLVRQRVKARSAEQFDAYAGLIAARDFVAPWEPGTPPYTIRLFSRDDGHHALLATFPSLVFDGRAHDLFASQLWDGYAGVPDLPGSSFAEAAAQQRRPLTDTQRDRTLRSWRTRLAAAAAAALTLVDGPLDRAVLGLELHGDRVTALRRECDRWGCTLVHRLLGAFATALTACTPRADPVLWTTIDGRAHTQRHVVGMFTSLVPVPVRTTGATVRETVDDVRAQLLEALRYSRITAAQRSAVMRETGVTPGAPVDVYVNIRQFAAGRHRATRERHGLRVTTDAFAMRGITRSNSAALQLRVDEYRDHVFLTLVNDGRRAPLSQAAAVLDHLDRSLIGV
ncbi:condensation domain-containing protein [Actinoplanes sp. NBRC 101535]|uniref:condensation domain-containing protein n=1 Tax=Actinoplanes sp. NBRC 101535 TaxID=3032196 RepID=UPI0024A296D9|nr:condensation domain-containing protein [Actinoplanes sp. NBRC 101535]GLY04041.1 hypothetical protein Acsp01_44200 [Actinoplanes sp. NBRC 101535]